MLQLISPRRYLHRLSGATLSGPRFGRKERVVSRAFLRFVRIDLSHVPESKRQAALLLELRAHKPYDNTQGVVSWSAGTANVFLWDEHALNATLDAQTGLGKLPVIPESWLYEPRQSGMRLLAGLDGFEGQYWVAGVLVGSRWWPDAPSALEWQGFSRDLGAFEAEPPKITRLPLLDKPVCRVEPIGQSTRQFAWIEPLVYAILVSGLLYAALDIWLQQRQLAAATAGKQAQIDRLHSKVGPLVDAKSKAETELQRINQILALHPMPDQLTLLADVTDALPNESVSVILWEYQNGKLKIMLRSMTTPISASQYVEALQRSKRLINVKALIGADPKTMTFAMDVVPLLPDSKPGGAHG